MIGLRFFPLKSANARGTGTRDEHLRTSAWGAIGCQFSPRLSRHIGCFRGFPKSARIGNSFLVLLGCPFGRYDLGTVIVTNRRVIKGAPDKGFAWVAMHVIMTETYATLFKGGAPSKRRIFSHSSNAHFEKLFKNHRPYFTA